MSRYLWHAAGLPYSLEDSYCHTKYSFPSYVQCAVQYSKYRLIYYIIKL